LELDLVLNNEGLSLVVNFLGELGRDGMMSCGVLDDKTLVAFHALVDMRLLDSPFSNICPFLIFLAGALGVLLGMGWLPSRLPIVGELLDKVTLDGCRLCGIKLVYQLGKTIALSLAFGELTVKVGSSGAEVADSTTEEASLATLEIEELASLRTD
jgi:hypothetical protein